jgi:hypothetical protein
MVRKIVIGIGGLIGLLLIVGLALPGRIHVERSATVAAPTSTVFATLNSLRQFNTWSPWAKRDPAALYTFSGPDAGVGARMEWKSETIGNGTQEIIAVDAARRITVALDFGGMGKATAYYALEPVEAGTALTWGFDEDVGMNLIGRYLGLIMNRMLGADYEEGLSNLKHLLEAPPPPTAK